MVFHEKAYVEQLRVQYPDGTRIELIHTDDPYTELKPGDQGTVWHVDDTGTLHVDWDSGSTLGVIPGEDYTITNAMIANVLEHGKHNQPKKPFLKPARTASRKECIRVMEQTFDSEVNKL